jgi:hypothetical protein
MKWKVFRACATGKYHLANDEPCQDAAHHTVLDDVFIGAVCDGAGSAARGQHGAEFFSKRVIELISEAVRAGDFTVAADFGAFLAPHIERARGELNEVATAQELTLRDYACTFVGCITSRSGGCFFHIGDGFGVYMQEGGESVLSQPENGEFSDETYFATDDYWREHLRITPLPAINQGVIGLMSDGAMPFAINRAKSGFYPPFIDPVVNFLRNASEPTGNAALLNVLSSEKTCEITPDDKTLLLAIAG